MKGSLFRASVNVEKSSQERLQMDIFVSLSLSVSALTANIFLFTFHQKYHIFIADYYKYVCKNISKEIGKTVHLERSPSSLSGRTFLYSCLFSLITIVVAIYIPFGPLISDAIIESVNENYSLSPNDILILLIVGTFPMYIPFVAAIILALFLGRSNNFRRSEKLRIYKYLGRCGMKDKERRDYLRDLIQSNIKKATRDISETQLN